MSSESPRLAERRLPVELHYSGVSRTGLFSKAIRLGLYTCTICTYIHIYIYIIASPRNVVIEPVPRVARTTSSQEVDELFEGAPPAAEGEDTFKY